MAWGHSVFPARVRWGTSLMLGLGNEPHRGNSPKIVPKPTAHPSWEPRLCRDDAELLHLFSQPAPSSLHASLPPEDVRLQVSDMPGVTQLVAELMSPDSRACTLMDEK